MKDRIGLLKVSERLLVFLHTGIVQGGARAGFPARYTTYTFMIKLIIWIVIGLLALSFFGISLRAIASSPTNQDNISFLVDTLRIGWGYIVAWFDTIIHGFLNLGN